MLFKMLNIELSWAQFGQDVSVKPRQLFLTRSQNLADKVKGSFARLYQTHVSGADGGFGGATDRSAAANIQSERDASPPGKFSDLDHDHFPLFVSVDTVSRSFGSVNVSLTTP